MTREQRYRLALQQIADPLTAVRAQCEAAGIAVNATIALHFVEDAAVLRHIAQRALARDHDDPPRGRPRLRPMQVGQHRNGHGAGEGTHE